MGVQTRWWVCVCVRDDYAPHDDGVVEDVQFLVPPDCRLMLRKGPLCAQPAARQVSPDE